jgi:hypothetical protein
MVTKIKELLPGHINVFRRL